MLNTSDMINDNTTTNTTMLFKMSAPTGSIQERIGNFFLKEEPEQTLHFFINSIIKHSKDLNEPNTSLSSNTKHSKDLNEPNTSLSSNTKQKINHLLQVFYITLSEVSDNNLARTEIMATSLIGFLFLEDLNIQLTSIKILKYLMDGNEGFKSFQSFIRMFNYDSNVIEKVP
uniref:DUF4704 domain-containing protein n=1 Tax=Meloidogyne hapla TaxID=6305 RepID=A0A1I8BDL5_MELHA